MDARLTATKARFLNSSPTAFRAPPLSLGWGLAWTRSLLRAKAMSSSANEVTAMSTTPRSTGAYCMSVMALPFSPITTWPSASNLLA